MKRSIGSAPMLSPSDFVAVFNQSLELMYPMVSIVGELAHFRVSKNRWVYFDLIDESASVRFFGTTSALPGPLEDGLNIEVFGVPRLHPKFGFSVNVASIRAIGDGSIAKAGKLLEKKLSAEGLFDHDRKRSLPYPPEKIGLITSVESAAYSDFMKIINHRWPAAEIVVEDVLVQGKDAPNQIVAALDKFNQAAEAPEVLVLTRGGGSQDDLSAFSVEQVVRAVAASRVPIIVGVGHESDVSLAELAADKRASTPSNAAELLVPNLEKEKDRIESCKKSIKLKLQSVYSSKLYETEVNRDKIRQGLNNIIVQLADRIERNRLILKALNPSAPLIKGFVLVKDKDGKIIKTAREALTNQNMRLLFRDGSINVVRSDK